MTAPRTTTSYSSLFGTNGAGTQNRIGSLFGQQSAAPRPTQTPTYQQTFAQMQQQGQARPAPPPPQAGQYGQYQGSGQAQAARAPMLQAVQQQLANPTRFNTQAFQQIRQAQQGNLNAEFGAQRSQLEEEMARRGLSASSIGAGRYGDLAGQQARASATLDADLLSQAAQTQAQDRLASLQAAGQFADLAGSQDLAQFEANRVGQAQQFQEGLASAQFGQGQSEFDRQQAMQAANLEQTGGLSGLDLALREQLGMGNLNLDAARLGQDADQFGQNLSLDRDRLAMQNNQFQQGFGLDQQRLQAQNQQFGQDLALRTQQLQQQAALEGRSLSLQEAQAQAQREQFTQSQRQQQSQFDMDQQLRQQLGLGDLDVRRQQATADAELGRNQMFMQLSQALSGLTAEQLQRLMNGTASGTTGQTGGNGPPGSDQGGNIDLDALRRQLEEWFRNNPIGGTA